MGSSLTANSARRNRVSKSGGFGYNQRVIDGTLTQLHLGDLLQWLRMGELSGRLTLIGNGYERRLDFFAGRLVYLSSLVPEERLGTVMVSEGLLPASVARQHLARSLVRRQPYTSILVEEGGIPVDVVISGLSRLARLILARVLAASEGSFSFDPNYPVQELPAAKIDIEALSLLEAASSDDQVKTLTRQPEEHTIPFTGDAFSNFFWEVVREGITAEDPVDGPQMAGLYNTIRDIMGALALCLGSSPGLDNCVSYTPIPTGNTELYVSEVMSNPLVESTGEYIEVYNYGSTAIDLWGLIVYDGDAWHFLREFQSGSTVVDPGEYAVIVDLDYTGQYSIPSGITVVTVDDGAIGSGLAASNDPVYLYEADGYSVIDSYTFPFNAGNGTSVSRVVLADGDLEDNWIAEPCDYTPGEAICPE